MLRAPWAVRRDWHGRLYWEGEGLCCGARVGGETRQPWLARRCVALAMVCASIS